LDQKGWIRVKSVIFDIQRFSVQDGPGIRTTVFIKGCPLRCLWCANPESQEHHPQVAHSDALCNNCGDCVSICPKQAICLTEDGICIDRTLCDNCTTCVEACVRGAIKLYGREMALEEVLDVVKRDLAYYRKTGGGVTASGGEPSLESEFVGELFEKCKALGIHTCLDTCGYTPPLVLKRILEYTDLVYYDVKLVDDARHRAVTGQSNDLILRNLHTVAQQMVPLVIRVPLVPGINSSNQDIEAIARVVATLPDGQEHEVHLLPYHRFGATKYQMLDRNYGLLDLPTIKASDLEAQRAKEIIERSGLKCRIVV
jgi:pyruvate formate lyase activating enzyme